MANKRKFHITANSKEVQKGSIFFALKGAKFDGHQFIEDAIKAGASKIYSENPYLHPIVEALGNKARKKMAEMASENFGHPTHALKMIGVTGTSGKTTTTYLIHHILNSTGHPCARIGTNGTAFNGIETETPNTTPDALLLQSYFADVKKQGATHVVMEVSSHALDQDRVWGIAWDAVTFLNLSPEHMDYHPTLDHYFETKTQLFGPHVIYSLSNGKVTKLSANGSNTYGLKLSKQNETIQVYSTAKSIRDLKTTPSGIEAKVFLKDVTYPEGQWLHLYCPLYGDFQIENILAALTVCTQLGVPASNAVVALRDFPGVPGRMESIPNQKNLLVFVDYAHKPEALEKVLLSIQPEVGSTRKLICVFGCGGDRDKTKRPKMGHIAARLSNALILTSDNPRTEDPMQILKEIQVGIDACIQAQTAKISHYDVIPDRAQAIEHAIQMAQPGDMVLIAGKGHETYQIFGSEKRYFDDREEAKKVLNAEALVPEADYYFNENGLFVITEAGHLKRGYCCKNGCKHCPYGFHLS